MTTIGFDLDIKRRGKTMSDYERYRGKCKEMSEELIKNNPLLTLVRGHYECPFWGSQQHWWVKDQEGNIIDPTVNQFPSKGIGAEYIEFNGILSCTECGKEIPEEQADIDGSHAFCSQQCYGRCVGCF